MVEIITETTKIKTNMNNNKSTVITAGGALQSQSSSKKKRNKKNRNNKSNNASSATVEDIEQQQATVATTATTATTTTTILPKQQYENPDDTGWSQNASINDLKKPTSSPKSPSATTTSPAVTDNNKELIQLDDLYDNNEKSEKGTSLNNQHNNNQHDNDNIDDNQDPLKSKENILWLIFCFLGIMASFVLYGLLLEYATSGGRKLHELSFLFVTSGVYTITAATGRYVRDETPTSIPPARFAILGITSMGSTFCSVRSLRYVIYPIQVLAKSCKPVPVMIMGALMGKKYPLRKYINVVLIVAGVALFMSGGSSSSSSKKHKVAAEVDESSSSSSQIIGIILLFISLCFDGGTGAYEDKLMAVHSVQPFDLMYNIQLGKTILAGIGLIILNQLHIFLQMCQDMGFLLIALGLSGAVGQVFIFITISKFGALTCSIIGLLRKVTTLVASIYFYGHTLNITQGIGLFISIGAMILNFLGKKKGGKGGHGGGHNDKQQQQDETEKMLLDTKDSLVEKEKEENKNSSSNKNDNNGDIELAKTSSSLK